LTLEGVWKNVFVMVICYAYIVLSILISGKLGQTLGWSEKASRKLLHMMIGNLSLVLPFFTSSAYPVAVCVPFILLTFLACPYSPSENMKKRLARLQTLTERGHPLGLFLYSISYTVLAVTFFDSPYLVAAGVLPMAYGDATGAIVGERFGKTTYKIIVEKSVEGSLGVFAASFLSVFCGWGYYSIFYTFSSFGIIGYSLVTALIATIVEAISPLGFDNLTVPLFCGFGLYLFKGASAF